MHRIISPCTCPSSACIINCYSSRRCSPPARPAGTRQPSRSSLARRIKMRSYSDEGSLCASRNKQPAPHYLALAGYGALALVLRARPDNRPATGYRRTEPPLPTGFPQREGPPPGGAALQRDEKPAEQAAPLDPSWWGITKGAVNQWVAHKDARLGAALADYSVFSLGPLIVIAIAVAGLLFGQEAVRGRLPGGSRDCWARRGRRLLKPCSRPPVVRVKGCLRRRSVSRR